MFFGFNIYGPISMMLSFLGFSILFFSMIDNAVLRNEMTHAALEKAKELTIEHRVKAIKEVVFGNKSALDFQI